MAAIKPEAVVPQSISVVIDIDSMEFGDPENIGPSLWNFESSSYGTRDKCRFESRHNDSDIGRRRSINFSVTVNTLICRC
jgi:hypothetical protein